jgi:hypothetical protein
MAVGWHLVVGGLTATETWADWQHSVSWVARGAVVQALLFGPPLLLVALGPGRLRRTALRLRPSDDDTPAHPGVYTAGTRTAWRRLGAFWAVGITAGTGTAM